MSKLPVKLPSHATVGGKTIESIEGAQRKADLAEQNAKNASIPRDGSIPIPIGNRFQIVHNKDLDSIDFEVLI